MDHEFYNPSGNDLCVYKIGPGRYCYHTAIQHYKENKMRLSFLAEITKRRKNKMRFKVDVNFNINVKIPIYASNKEEAIKSVPTIVYIATDLPASKVGDPTEMILTYLGGEAEEIPDPDDEGKNHTHLNRLITKIGIPKGY